MYFHMNRLQSAFPIDHIEEEKLGGGDDGKPVCNFTIEFPPPHLISRALNSEPTNGSSLCSRSNNFRCFDFAVYLKHPESGGKNETACIEGKKGRPPPISWK